MRNFLLTTVAALALISTGALAASTGDTTPATTATSANGVTEGTGRLVERNQIEPRTLVGKTVVDVNGDKIGSVDDVILAPSGQAAQQAVIKSGGFLGIGEKLIAVPISDLKPGDDKNRLVVTGLTREQVRDMRTFAYDQSTRSWRNSQPGTVGAVTAPNGPVPAAGMAAAIQPRMLIGKEVVDTNGKHIGSIDNVLMDASGNKPEKAVIASGGFLGIGQKLIAVDFSQLSLPTAATGAQPANNNANNSANNANGQGVTVPPGAPADVAVVTGLTQDQVKDMPDFRYDPSMRRLSQEEQTAPAAIGSGSTAPRATASPTDNGSANATASASGDTTDLKKLIGKVVVDSEGARVGTVDNVLMRASGDKPERAVIASGGFLGIGEKLISVDFSQLTMGTDGRVHVSGLTREQVRDMKDFRYEPSMRTYRKAS